MVPVSCIWIGIKLASISGGMQKKIPCTHKTKEPMNMNAQFGSVHHSRMVSERTLVMLRAAAPAMGA